MSRSHLYTLYIDESGIRYPQHKTAQRNDGMDHFCWGGILVNQDDEQAIIGTLKEFRNKWSIDYPLHSTEIRSFRDNFSWLGKDEPSRKHFFDDLNELLLTSPVLGFGVVVSRPGYNERYKAKYGSGRWELCKSTHPILIERVVRYLLKIDPEARLRIIFEGSSGAENKLIVGYTRDIKRKHIFSPDESSKYNALSPRIYDRVIIGDALTGKKGNYFLQLADLYIYPIAKRAYQADYLPWVLFFESQRVIDALLEPSVRKLEGIKYYCFD